MSASSAKRILLIEDQEVQVSILKGFIERKTDFVVDVEMRGDTAVGRILGERPDLVILDIQLPGLDGLEVCKKVRRHYLGPIILLTGRSSVIDQWNGFDAGADDYIPKPASPRLILARVEALLSRDSPREASDRGYDSPAEVQEDEARRVDLNYLCIDAEDRSVTISGKSVELTNSEFNLLWLLACRAGKPVHREELFKCLRDRAWDGLDRSVDVAIVKLRKKLGEHGKRPKYIKSVRGVGYKILKGLP